VPSVVIDKLLTTISSSRSILDLCCVVLYSVRASEPNLMSSPFFPVDLLKQLMMENLTEAVSKGAAHIRDPIGGCNETLFV